MTDVSVAEFRYADGGRLIEFWRRRYAEHHVPLREPEAGMLIADAGSARVTMRVAGKACRIEICCEDAAHLPEFRTGISLQSAEIDPDLPPLEWSGAGAAGALPPTFASARVVGCRPVGRSWWRMSLRLDPAGYARFSEADHWHLRLLRPVEAGRDPVWPRLSATGTIAWPGGADRLTDRVFTVRTCDAGSGTINIDIFRHPGGPTSDWAEAFPLGQTIGLMGPGARGGPSVGAGGGWILAGGDETAVPAILRGLETLPEGTGGQVFLLVGHAGDRQPRPATGPRVTWMLRSKGAAEETLIAAVQGAPMPGSGEGRLWFAASKQGARRIRSCFRDDAVFPKAAIHAVGYWS